MLSRTKFRPRYCAAIESLEDRCLLSVSHHGFGGFGGFGGGWGHSSAILYSQAPAAVQSGFTDLATTDNLTLLTDSTTVYLGNRGGVETYTIDITANGVDNRLTVNLAGKAVTAPTSTSTTFGALTNAAVSTELTTIATALNLTAPASTDNVTVITGSDGTQTFAYRFASTGRHGTSVTLDADGNPVGNTRLPLSVFSKTISDALVNAAPVGATPLTDTSLVTVKTANGVTTYSAIFTSTGTVTTVTVDNTGTLTSLPTTTIVQFSTIPTAAQTEIQTLATAKGYTGTIAGTQNVKAYNEANGTTVYSVRLPVSKTGNSGGTFTFMIQVSSDQSGNPTVPPSDGGGEGFGFGGFGGFGGGFGFGGFGFGGGGCSGGSSGSGSSTGTTTTSPAGVIFRRLFGF